MQTDPVVERIAKDLEQSGFSTFSLPLALFDEGLALSRRFFEFDERARLNALASASSGVLGFYPSESAAEKLKDIVTLATLSGARARGYSSFDFIDEAVAGSSRVLKHNVWPDLAFGADALNIYRAIAAESRKLAVGLVEYWAKSGACKTSADVALRAPCCSLMRLLCYEAAERPIESKAHTDYELYSLVWGTAPGLMVKDRAGSWHMLATPAPTAVLLAGDMAEALTGGEVQSALHRVRVEGGARYSAIFFQGLSLDAPIDYERDGVTCPATFGKHILPLLTRGAAHLDRDQEAIEAEIGCTIPLSNLFKSRKLDE